MKYYLVLPLTHIGKEMDYLTYQYEGEIAIGCAVKIPFRNKNIVGIVTNETEKPEFTTKEIEEIIFDKPVLTKEMIILSNWISKYYSASNVSVLQSIIPSGIAKNRREKANNKQANYSLEEFPTLNNDQKTIVQEITKSNNNKPHLIFGVTGSGKTEIYINLIKDTLAKNKSVIVLVPEISLTPQALDRYTKRFGNTVTILHSYLKETERFANWKAALEGEKQIIVGSRSAIFAPLNNLGLIIIDEEHETSYKQDRTPRYQTVKVAEKLSDLTGAKLVLGSATPKIETYYKALNGTYNLHKLNKRFIQSSMPETEIIDMRNELKYGNRSIFSEELQINIRENLKNKRQVILFLNRRGMSTFVSCRECGFVEKCPSCDTSLTFHYQAINLICHHCGFTKKPEPICPNCKSHAIKYFGTGTQKVENEAKNIFGEKYSIGRMDADTTKTRGSHEAFYDNVANKNYDIIIGTQMISKGWDFPNIGLIGIISADTMINFPDYTAAEKTFNLLTQVGGRTGRGEENGKVIIQTYNPDYPAIITASSHDYEAFYEQEIINRKELSYPPFAFIIKIVYNNVIQIDAKKASEKAKELVENELERLNIPFEILGPSPAFMPKLNNKYYYQISIKLFNEADNLKVVDSLNKILNNDWSIDVDPADLL